MHTKVRVCVTEKELFMRVRVREPSDGTFSGGAMDWDACCEAASILEAEECAAYAYTCIYMHRVRV